MSSRRPPLLWLSLTLFASAMSAQEPALTNKSIIEMVGGKLPNELIILKIKSSPAVFDVTTAGLVKLSEAKVPTEVIKAMLAAPHGAPATTTPARVAYERPAAQDGSGSNIVGSTQAALTGRSKQLVEDIPTDPGIYVYADGIPLTVMEATRYTSGRSSNVLGAALTFGISKAKMKSSISGADASLRFADPYPEFYFVFEQGDSRLGSNDMAAMQLTSPNEFTLVRLDRKEGHREITTASMGAYSSQTGTDDKVIVGFTLIRLRPGVYRVSVRTALTPGEYAFFPASVGGTGSAGTNRLFDFGVDGR